MTTAVGSRRENSETLFAMPEIAADRRAAGRPRRHHDGRPERRLLLWRAGLRLRVQLLPGPELLVRPLTPEGRATDSRPARRGESCRSHLLKRMKESGWCWPTIASGRVYGGQFTASPSSSRPFSMPLARGLAAPHRR